VISTFPSGCAQRLRAAGSGEPASEKPGASSFHLFVEHVDIADHRFALLGRVVVVGVVNSNQILRHDFSFSLTAYEPGGCPAFTTSSNGGPEFDKSFKKIFLLPMAALPAKVW